MHQPCSVAASQYLAQDHVVIVCKKRAENNRDAIAERRHIHCLLWTVVDYSGVTIRSVTTCTSVAMY